jgi:hypothetical protein
MHGASYSNVLFMQNDSQILEVMPYAWLKVPGADIISKRYITPITNIYHERLLTEDASRVSVTPKLPAGDQFSMQVSSRSIVDSMPPAVAAFSSSWSAALKS